MFEDEQISQDNLFEPEAAEGEAVDASYSRQELALRMLRHVHESLGYVMELLEQNETSNAKQQLAQLLSTKSVFMRQKDEAMGTRVLEGVFDGTNMVGEDGHVYPVPPNYASKSRLVEGDILKLTLQADGTHVFKQIRPIERRRIVGVLSYDEEAQVHVVTAEEVMYQVLPASISYHRGVVGDPVVLAIPKSGGSRWAAVETIMKKQ
ncbi:TPA: hypothetical protein DEP34_04735 [Candidatus Uhrbacteria bacterium]|uniref:50S ribosomal protein L7/L12 n=2 Tax=Candidatus Uhriibacteriota TaxID=1752732 RepID=A0A0G1T602_9BACT|nr:MAG: 50S ribosomal protein L7/L12 [Candidatus Uhrbacteria bacterium GW2011_GWF2_46_218]KKU40840.1 MAG: 50S ribosomal protein L7/L12 [Candidatus Uhrbacteria bacterium GW2011_GWE2_46_68]HBK33926.1 hypothetical protein [Candidatus Uhrbacteria bacterium]HCB19649.1 hypothetical protein [Candidatus Uhrbacteria bacterium]